MKYEMGLAVAERSSLQKHMISLKSWSMESVKWRSRKLFGAIIKAFGEFFDHTLGARTLARERDESLLQSPYCSS